MGIRKFNFIKDNIYAGNGSGMKISHLGKSLLHSQLSNSTFKLHNLLNVPSINKNLISVSKFASDNNVFFEFHPNVCFVKSQVSKEILLQGTLKEGLYQFNDVKILQKSSVPRVCHVSYKTVSSVFDLWHKKLGHPSSKIVTQVLSQCNIPSSVNKMCNSDFTFLCDACCMGKLHQLPFSDSTTHYAAPLDLIYSDLWGLAPMYGRQWILYLLYRCTLQVHMHLSTSK